MVPVLKTRGLSPTWTRTRSNIFKDHFDQKHHLTTKTLLLTAIVKPGQAYLPPPPPRQPPKIPLKNQICIAATALHSVKWIKMLWGHLHQIQENWAGRNFITTSCMNRLFPHSCKQRHQLEAQTKYSGLYEIVHLSLVLISICLLTEA